MTSRRAALIAATALLALAAFAAGMLLSRPAPRGSSAEPSQGAVEKLSGAPLFDTEGRETTLAPWRGKPMIVNFWATWCPPCLKEMPVFSTLQERHREVQFVGIAIDTPDNVRNFSTSNRFSYPLLVASEGVMGLMTELGNSRNGLPFTVAIDRSGTVKHVKLGGLSEAETEQIIASLK